MKNEVIYHWSEFVNAFEKSRAELNEEFRQMDRNRHDGEWMPLSFVRFHPIKCFGIAITIYLLSVAVIIICDKLNLIHGFGGIILFFMTLILQLTFLKITNIYDKGTVTPSSPSIWQTWNKKLLEVFGDKKEVYRIGLEYELYIKEKDNKIILGMIGFMTLFITIYRFFFGSFLDSFQFFEGLYLEQILFSLGYTSVGFIYFVKVYAPLSWLKHLKKVTETEKVFVN